MDHRQQVLIFQSHNQILNPYFVKKSFGLKYYTFIKCYSQAFCYPHQQLFTLVLHHQLLPSPMVALPQIWSISLFRAVFIPSLGYASVIIYFLSFSF